MRLLVWLLLAVFIWAPHVARAADLTIMAEDASEPFSRADGSGYANDIVRAAFQAAHVDVKLDIVPYARCKKSLEEGKTPACFGMSWLPEFRNRIVFSDQPLFEVHAGLFRNRTQADKPLGKGATVGIVNGYEYPDGLSRLAQSGVVLEHAEDELALLKMVARGRLDGAVVMTSDFADASTRLAAAGVSGSVVYGSHIGTMQSFIGFSLANPQGAWARQAFNEGYKIIIRNHERDRIREKWLKAVRP